MVAKEVMMMNSWGVKLIKFQKGSISQGCWTSVCLFVCLHYDKEP